MGLVPPYSLWLPLRGVRPANKIKNVEALHILFRLKSSSIIGELSLIWERVLLSYMLYVLKAKHPSP